MLFIVINLKREGHGLPFLVVRPAWAQSNGCKSRVRVDSAKHIARVRVSIARWNLKETGGELLV